MHDIKSIRDNPEAFRADLLRRKPDAAAADALLARLIALDDARRAAIGRAQAAQERRNAASKEIGAAMKAKDMALADKLKQEVADLKTGMGAIEAEEKAAILALDRHWRPSPTARCPTSPGRRRERQCRIAPCRGQAGASRLQAERAFRDRRSARPDGFRGGVAHVRRAFRRAQGQAGAAGAGARPVHARPAHRHHGYQEVAPPLLVRDARHVRHGAIAEVQGRPVRGVDSSGRAFAKRYKLTQQDDIAA